MGLFTKAPTEVTFKEFSDAVQTITGNKDSNHVKDIVIISKLRIRYPPSRHHKRDETLWRVKSTFRMNGNEIYFRFKARGFDETFEFTKGEGFYAGQGKISFVIDGEEVTIT